MNMKQTRQKTLILNQVSNRTDHPTAELNTIGLCYDKLTELSLIDPHISLATVYRNLNAFAMKGKIRKIEIPNAKDRFDWDLHHHDHALCLCCGNVVDIESKHVRKRHMVLDGFKVQEIELLYKGVCQNCQNEKAS